MQTKEPNIPIAGPTMGIRSHLVANAPHPILQPVRRPVVSVGVIAPSQGSTVSLPAFRSASSPVKSMV